MGLGPPIGRCSATPSERAPRRQLPLSSLLASGARAAPTHPAAHTHSAHIEAVPNPWNPSLLQFTHGVCVRVRARARARMCRSGCARVSIVPFAPS